jgi:hypothetical protein
LLIPFDQKPLTSQIKEADEFDLISLIGRPHTERSSAVFDDLQSEGREIVELEKRKYRSATFSLVVNFQSPFRRHSSNPRAIQPLEDHHEQSSHDSDGHQRDKTNPDGDGDTSGNRAHAHRSFPPTKPGFKRADNNWFRTAGSNGEPVGGHTSCVSKWMSESNGIGRDHRQRRGMALRHDRKAGLGALGLLRRATPGRADNSDVARAIVVAP